ncbi:MAG: TIGR04282 family arsenosugar biosynthesis glycosyltransferase [Nakamurella sp.]
MSGSLRDAPAGQQIARALRGCRLIRQRGPTFGERLAHAHLDAAGPFGQVLQIATDTPQVTPDLLQQSILALHHGADAALGPAEDGGWWALALREARYARVLAGVPMSTPDTRRHTASALSTAGLVIAPLPTLVDADTAADADKVARSAPGTRFGRLAGLLLGAARPFPVPVGAIPDPHAPHALSRTLR